MNLSGEYRFDAKQDDVWNVLMDPDAIAKAIPGVDEFVPVEGKPNTWNAKAKINVATVNGQYMGTISMSEQEPPSEYVLTVNGEGQQSIIGGSARIKLDYDHEASQTVLTWDAEANISGKMARIGQRVIKAAAALLSKRFFADIARQLDPAQETDS